MDQKKTIRALKKKVAYYKERVVKDKQEKEDLIAPIADITRKSNAVNQNAQSKA